VNDIFVIWPKDTEVIQNFLTLLNNLRPAIQFTIEIDSDGANTFMDFLVIKKTGSEYVGSKSS
jgi:hypothetical protein